MGERERGTISDRTDQLERDAAVNATRNLIPASTSVYLGRFLSDNGPGYRVDRSC